VVQAGKIAVEGLRRIEFVFEKDEKDKSALLALPIPRLFLCRRPVEITD
jgi:hypothetical protein